MTQSSPPKGPPVSRDPLDLELRATLAGALVFIAIAVFFFPTY